jgi:hypothetical protein
MLVSVMPKYHACQFVRRMLLKKDLSNVNIVKAKEIHCHWTRGSDDIRLEKASTSRFSLNSVRYSAFSLYNKRPKNIKNIKNESEFKCRLRALCLGEFVKQKCTVADFVKL